MGHVPPRDSPRLAARERLRGASREAVRERLRVADVRRQEHVARRQRLGAEDVEGPRGELRRRRVLDAAARRRAPDANAQRPRRALDALQGVGLHVRGQHASRAERAARQGHEAAPTADL